MVESILAPVAASCDIESITLSGNESQTHHFDDAGREDTARRERRVFRHLPVIEPALSLMPDTPLQDAAAEALARINATELRHGRRSAARR
jgi:hypothetical protein